MIVVIIFKLKFEDARSSAVNEVQAVDYRNVYTAERIALIGSDFNQ